MTILGGCGTGRIIIILQIIMMSRIMTVAADSEHIVGRTAFKRVLHGQSRTCATVIYSTTRYDFTNLGVGIAPQRDSLARETRVMVHLNFAQNTFLETCFSTLLGEMGEWSAWGNASTDCGIGSSCIMYHTSVSRLRHEKR